MIWRRDRRAGQSAGDGGPRLAIVGGGFSGTVLLAHLVDRVPPGAVIEIFDARGEFGTGTAYATRDGRHLLNVPAGRMGAFAPDHFWHWLESKAGLAARARYCPERSIAPSDFLPRAVYGLYLKDILQIALQRAAERGVAVSLNKAKVVDVQARGAALDIASEQDGGPAVARFDALVLATGNFPRRSPPGLPRELLRSRRYVADLWHDPSERLRRLPGGTVLLVGTGLTAVDAVLTLERQGFKGKIVAASRHGRLPHAHAPTQGAWNWVVKPEDVAPTALAFVHWLKSEARHATAAGIDWRVVFDALRPITPVLWRKLAPPEQVKLLRRHTLWSIHRHRMALDARTAIENLQQDGHLEIVAASIVSASTGLGGFRVALRRRGSPSTETLRPALVVNCTGSEYDIAKAGDRFLSNLADKDFIRRSPNGLGIVVDRNRVARGIGQGRIFVIGPLLVGDAFECTAVPELREQARLLALQLAALGTPKPAGQAVP